jgi:hypothetical protein
MYWETYIKRWDPAGDTIIASEACGGVVESNMTKGTDHYLAMNLKQYIERRCPLVGTFEINRFLVK